MRELESFSFPVLKTVNASLSITSVETKVNVSLIFPRLEYLGLDLEVQYINCWRLEFSILRKIDNGDIVFNYGELAETSFPTLESCKSIHTDGHAVWSGIVDLSSLRTVHGDGLYFFSMGSVNLAPLLKK
jgi:hypothetical protein